MKNKYLYLSTLLPLFLLATGLLGCKKLITVSPPETAIAQANVYNADATAIAVLTGIYANISNATPVQPGTIPGLTLYTELSGDELTLWSGVSSLTATAYYTNALTGVLNGYGSEFWANTYPAIFSCNAAIEGLNGSSGLTPAVKQQLLGEAKFMRAFFYFYLVNLYGDVPLALSSDYKINSSLARSSSATVYQQIIADLHDAQQSLSTNFLDASVEQTSSDRVRPTLWAATALLARTYLYNGNWTGADSAASVLIANSSLFGLSPLNNAFLRASLGNNEAIWQLQPVTNNPPNTMDGYVFIIPSTGLSTGGNFGTYLSSFLINSFEPGDQRLTNWTDTITLSGTTYYYPYKYKINSTDPSTPVTEYLMMLRLGEQYLIRAEARAYEGNVGGAQNDLDSIRSRAGLPGTSASTQSTLLSAILHERQVELFAELGHRWMDLKRMTSIDSVMSLVTPQKGGGMWNSYQQLYPVLYNDLQLDPNLQQNPGYN
jgi:hypothetical protein